MSVLTIHPIASINQKAASRFWSRVSKGEHDTCWEWTAGRSVNGYGKVKISKRTYMSHRIAYFLHYRSDPGELFVCHSCDNKVCCNPNHLWLGTCSDNANDCKIKGRLNTAKGDNHYTKRRPELIRFGDKNSNAKLSIGDVIEIRRRASSRSESTQQIGDSFGVSRALVRKIRDGLIWRRVPTAEPSQSLS